MDEHEQAATVYVERYLDVVQNIPNDLQLVISHVRELDTRTCMELHEYDSRHTAYVKDLKSGDSAARARSHVALRRSLVREREYGDEKLKLANQLVDMVEGAVRELDEDLQRLEAARVEPEYAMTNGGYARQHDFPVLDGSHSSVGATSNSHPHAPAGNISALVHHHHVASAGTPASGVHFQHRGDERSSVPGPKPKRAKKVKTDLRDGDDATASAAQRRTDGTTAAAAAAANSAHGNSVASVGRPEGKKKRREGKVSSKRQSTDRDRTAGATAQKAFATSSGSAIGKQVVPQLPPDIPVDPNEPTYCICRQVSYGEMIGCDNTSCTIEWYHFGCVGLTSKPKGKWYCPNCRPVQAKLSSDKAGRGR